MKTRLFFVALAMCLAFVSCKKDEKDARDNYVGTYRVDEKMTVDGGIYLDNYNISITKSSANGTDIVINGLLGVPSISAVASVNGDSFTIPQQTFSDVGLSGSGRRNGNSLTIYILATITGSGQANFELSAMKL